MPSFTKKGRMTQTMEPKACKAEPQATEDYSQTWKPHGACSAGFKNCLGMVNYSFLHFWMECLQLVPFIYPACVLSCFSCVQLFATLWTVTCQAPLSKGFSSQEYWSGLPWPPPGDLSNLGIKPASRMPPALSGRFFTTTAIWKPLISPTTAFWKQRICFYLHKSMDGE